MSALGPVWALCLTTFREAMRNKILYTILGFGCALIFSSWAVSQLSLHEEARVARDMGLFGIFFFGVVLSIVGGVTLVYQEIERKTVYALIPKPIRRVQFVAGKYAGLSLTLAVQMGLMSGVLFLALWWLGGDIDGGVIRAIVLLYVEVLLVTAVAVLFSTFSTPLLSGLYTAGITLCGIFIPELRAIIWAKVGPDSPEAARVLAALTQLIPDLHLFFVSGSMLGGKWVSVHSTYVDWAYVLFTSIYGLGFAAGVLAVAMWAFSRRDFV